MKRYLKIHQHGVYFTTNRITVMDLINVRDGRIENIFDLETGTVYNAVEGNWERVIPL